MNNSQGHDSRAIANIFVEKSQNVEYPHQLTIMSLLKYVYFAHGWTLGYTGEPLICHEVQAWKYGPVVPEVYHAFRGKGFIVRQKAIDPETKKPYEVNQMGLTDRQLSIINGVFDKYSKLGAFELSYATHHPASPWSQYDGDFYSIIPDPVIEKYYKKAVNNIKNGG